MEDSWTTRSGSRHWTTADERVFLDHLGTHTEHQGDRLTLLRRYQASMRHRVSWGAVDEGAVRAYVETLLAPEENHA